MPKVQSKCYTINVHHSYFVLLETEHILKTLRSESNLLTIRLDALAILGVKVKLLGDKISMFMVALKDTRDQRLGRGSCQLPSQILYTLYGHP